MALLIVDDEETNRDMLSRRLQRQGFEVELAGNGPEALASIRSRVPDMVLLDIRMPGMSGMEAVKRLREWPETRDIPVIGLSAAALVKDTSRAKDAGFYRYLTKPVKVAELTATLEELLVGSP